MDLFGEEKIADYVENFCGGEHNFKYVRDDMNKV